MQNGQLTDEQIAYLREWVSGGSLETVTPGDILTAIDELIAARERLADLAVLLAAAHDEIEAQQARYDALTGTAAYVVYPPQGGATATLQDAGRVSVRPVIDEDGE